MKCNLRNRCQAAKPNCEDHIANAKNCLIPLPGSSDYAMKKEAEMKILENVMKLAVPSLDPERFEALTDALNQLAKNRNINFTA